MRLLVGYLKVGWTERVRSFGFELRVPEFHFPCCASCSHFITRIPDIVTHTVWVGNLSCAVIAWPSDSELVCDVVGNAVVGVYEVRVAVLNQVS